MNTTEENQPKPNPVAANAEINIPWTLPIRDILMTDMMKKAVNAEVGRRTVQAKYRKLKNKVQQLTSAVSTPTTTKQRATIAKTTAASTSGTLKNRAATTAGKTATKTTKAVTTVAPSVPQVVIKTEPAVPAKTKANKTTTSYTGPITRAKAKKKAQVHLLESIPEDLLSESEDEEYDLLKDLQSALAEDDSEFEEVESEPPDSDVEVDKQ